MVPSYLGHVITENRNGLVVATMATQSGNAAEREAALKMLTRIKRGKPMTLGADKSDQEETFVGSLRKQRVAPHVAEYAPNPKWRNWLTEEERSDPGLAVSQKKSMVRRWIASVIVDVGNESAQIYSVYVWAMP